MSVLRRRAMMRPPDFGYVRDGLLLHLDGIYNTWGGHDPGATEWYDLSGSGNSAEVVDGMWSASSLTPNGSCVVEMAGKNTYSYEIICRYINGSTDSLIGIMDENSNRIGLAPIGRFNDDSIRVGFASGNTSGSYVETGLTIQALAVRPHSIVGAFEGPAASASRTLSVYVDGGLIETASRSVISDQNAAKINIGRDLRWGGFGGANEVFAVRVYGRALTAGEVAHNYAIDKRRFGL